MRVLVTGGAGYVGSVVAAVLLDAGHQVCVLDDLSTGHRDAVPPGADFVRAGIAEAEPAFVEAERAGAPFEAVLHFAAKSLVAESVAEPQLYWANNLCGSLALLETMRAHQVRRIVFSSTAATYGEPTTVPIEESAATAPTNPYGASKLAVDQLLTGYAGAHGFAAVSLRYFNVGGARLSGPVPIGERHTTETHLIPIALQVAAGQRDQLQISGVDYPTPDGSCIRDYIHVLDLAEAHLLALESTGSEPGHLICNLGSGSGYSVREVLDTVRRITGRPTPAVEAGRRPGDPAVLVASNERARSSLGWRPTRGLDEMVADAWSFAQRVVSGGSASGGSALGGSA